MNGSSNINEAWVKMVLITSNESILEYSLKLGFKANNNEVEYEALLTCLRIMAELQVNELSFHCDSMMII